MTKTKGQKKDEHQPSDTKSDVAKVGNSKPVKPKEPKTAKAAKGSKNVKSSSKKTKETKESKDTVEEAKRSFKGIYVNCDGTVVMSGRYCGKKPMQAARKALTAIYRLYNNYNVLHPKNKKTLDGYVYFGVKETSRQSKHKKTYWYAGEKQELEVPHERVLNTIDEKTGKNKVIIHKSKNNVKKASLDECKHLLQYVEEDDEDEKPKVKKQSKKTKDESKKTKAKTPAKRKVKTEVKADSSESESESDVAPEPVAKTKKTPVKKDEPKTKKSKK